MQRSANKLHFFTLLLFIVSCTLVWSATFAKETGVLLTVAFLDVGQGDAIFIEAPNKTQVLIDGGPDASVMRELSRVMSVWDRSLDIVIATHPDADHIEGLIDILDQYDVRALITTGAKKDTGIFETFSEKVQQEDALQVLARRGERIVLDADAGVYLEVLFPDHDMQAIADANEGSIMLRLVFGESEFLFTGDAPKIIEEYVTSLGSQFVEADVLKVGHHGSKTSTSEYFLTAVNPSYAVITASENNPYGHPHDEVLQSLVDQNITTYTTFENGTVVFESDGTSTWVVE